MEYKALYEACKEIYNSNTIKTQSDFLKHYYNLNDLYKRYTYNDNEYMPLFFELNEINNGKCLHTTNELYDIYSISMSDFANKDRSYSNDANKYKQSVQIKNMIQYKYKCENVTTAWIKMYEILEKCNILSDYDISNVLDVFFICELPGAFIFALNHFIKTKTEIKYRWFAQSLNPKKRDDVFDDKFGLVQNYANNYDFGPNDGDITKTENISYYEKKYKSDLVISDCGWDASDDFIKQEKNLIGLLKAEIMLGLKILKSRGNFIFKSYTFFTDEMRDLLWILYNSFKSVIVTKPISSKKFSNETYIICKEFKGYNPSSLISTISDIFSNNCNKCNETFIYKRLYLNMMDLLKDKYWNLFDNNTIKILTDEKNIVITNFITKLNLKNISDNDRLIKR